MTKIFILDTSVLIQDPTAFLSFKDNTVILPAIVLSELDKVKTYASAGGRSARIAIRYLDELCAKGEIHKGIKIDNGIELKVDTSAYTAIGDPKYGDSKILAAAVDIKKKNPDREVILVSRDINLRVLARSFDIEAEDYQAGKIETDDLYSGVKIINNEAAGKELKKSGSFSKDKYELGEVYQNQFILFTDNDQNIVSGRLVEDTVVLVESINAWSITGRNKEQLYALDLLLDPAIPLVSLVGSAGTGKTLIALAASLELLITKKKYSKLIIYRPIQSMGNDLGYLPGSLAEKLDPWLVPIKDNLEFLVGVKPKKNGPKDPDAWKNKLAQFSDQIQMEALTYVRGRSIPNSIILIDEAQNLSREEMKTILTRVGVDSKIIITGDIFQIDHPHLDAMNNGLSYIVEKFKESELAGHITLTKGERSALATLAANIL